MSSIIYVISEQSIFAPLKLRHSRYILDLVSLTFKVPRKVTLYLNMAGITALYSLLIFGISAWKAHVLNLKISGETTVYSTSITDAGRMSGSVNFVTLRYSLTFSVKISLILREVVLIEPSGARL